MRLKYLSFFFFLTFLYFNRMSMFESAGNKTILAKVFVDFQKPTDLGLQCLQRQITIFDLITAHTPISTQSSNSIIQITASVLFVYFFIKAYVVGTHLNCIGFSRTRVKAWFISRYFYKKKNKKKQKGFFSVLQNTVTSTIFNQFMLNGLIYLKSMDRSFSSRKGVCLMLLQEFLYLTQTE